MMMITTLNTTPMTSYTAPRKMGTDTVKKQQVQGAKQPLTADSIQFSSSKPREEATPLEVTSAETLNNPPALSTVATDSAAVASPSSPTVSPLPAEQPQSMVAATPSTLPPAGLTGTMVNAGLTALGLLGLGIVALGHHKEIQYLNRELKLARQRIADLKNDVIPGLQAAQNVFATGLTEMLGENKGLKKTVAVLSWKETHPNPIKKLPSNAPVINDWGQDWFTKGLDSFEALKGKFFDDKNTIFNNDTANIALRQDARFLAETVLPAFQTHIEASSTEPTMQALLRTVNTLLPAFEEIDPEKASESSSYWHAITENVGSLPTEAEELAAKIKKHRLTSQDTEGLKPFVEEVYKLLQKQLEAIQTPVA
jgi:hypothetical protein